MADVARWREEDLARLHGMGPKGMRILAEALAVRHDGPGLTEKERA